MKDLSHHQLEVRIVCAYFQLIRKLTGLGDILASESDQNVGHHLIVLTLSNLANSVVVHHRLKPVIDNCISAVL
jgi:hypothetical protein